MNLILRASLCRQAGGHSRQAKDTKQKNKNNSIDWFIQNINTIALVEPAWLADRGINRLKRLMQKF